MWLNILLLLSGDIETNPGPPKRGPPGGGQFTIQMNSFNNSYLMFSSHFRQKRTYKRRDNSCFKRKG